jgi:Transposase IS200 like
LKRLRSREKEIASIHEEGSARAKDMEDAMKEWQSMAHVKWECKYHIVFISKYCKKKLYGNVRERIGEIFQEL